MSAASPSSAWNESNTGCVSSSRWGRPESAAAILALLEAGRANGGELPGVSTPFFSGAMPRNVSLFVTCATAHEAHHRGRIVLMARELGQRLPAPVVTGLWQWSSRLRESRSGVERNPIPSRLAALAVEHPPADVKKGSGEPGPVAPGVGRAQSIWGSPRPALDRGPGLP